MKTERQDKTFGSERGVNMETGLTTSGSGFQFAGSVEPKPQPEPKDVQKAGKEVVVSA
jgi:hypothetical protein